MMIPLKITHSDTQFGHLIGQSTSMQAVYHSIQKVAPSSATVLIIGESGTGKELVAKTIHEMSHRSNKPFIAINCGAISQELTSSALFGHERGSFTGAVTSHQGYFEQASGGTLFLDELSETSPEFQVKLLRVLETGKIIPVGGKRQITIDCRILVAMNRNPAQAVHEGILRKDLFYRINGFPISLPALKDRKDDIVVLARFFLDGFNKQYQKNVSLSPSADDILQSQNWHGNVRELKNTLHRAHILADKEIGHKQLYNPPLNRTNLDVLSIPIGTTLKEIYYQLSKATLKKLAHDKIKTASMLGINLGELGRLLGNKLIAAT